MPSSGQSCVCSLPTTPRRIEVTCLPNKPDALALDQLFSAARTRNGCTGRPVPGYDSEAVSRIRGLYFQKKPLRPDLPRL